MSEFREELKVLGVTRWLYHRWLYRPLMKGSHRYGWHHAPKTIMEDGSTMEWCTWCGMRRATRPAERVLRGIGGAKAA